MSRQVLCSRKIILGTMLGACLVISGCGQKGPLHLPGQKEASQQPTNSPATETMVQNMAQNIIQNIT